MFTCNYCQHSSSTKLWKCPNCNRFGTFEVDKKLSKPEKKSKHIIWEGNILERKTMANSPSRFFSLQNKEFLRVFSNWIKAGGMYLLGGAPGIGKSTLIVQILQEILNHNEIRIWYFSGEEQENQILDRWERIKKNNKVFPSNVEAAGGSYIFHATHLEDILSTTKKNKFDFIVIDSIQTIYSAHTESAAGSPNQVKYCAEKLSEFCKQRGITIFIIGHVTKGGEIAGPKYLEHIVDVVLYLEGDKFGQLRFLRSQKNRFGHTDDSGIFEMTLFGLQPVYDLKERILKSANTQSPGSVLTIWLDNGRPVLTYVEVLLNSTKYKFPSRNCIGVSSKRVDLVIAILERYLKLDLAMFDVFVNVPNEFDFQDSGLDLAIAAGILSQYRNQKLGQDSVFIGELGLWGQVVRTKLHEKRLREIPDGFEKIDFKSMKNIVEIKSFL